jgi:hypothetical protein
MFDRGVVQKLLVAVALVLGLYDAYELYEGVTDFNRHVPFLLPGVFLAFAIMISIARRFTLTPEEHAELQRQNALQKATQSLDPFKDDPSSF